MTADSTCHVCGISYDEAHRRPEGARWSFHWAGPVEEPFIEVCSDGCWEKAGARGRSRSDVQPGQGGVFDLLSRHSIYCGDAEAGARSRLRQELSWFTHEAFRAPSDELDRYLERVRFRTVFISDMARLRGAMTAEDPAAALLAVSCSLHDTRLNEMAAEFAAKVAFADDPMEEL